MNNKYFELSAKVILARNGGCFGISCGDCPLHGEYIEQNGYICHGGGQGMYYHIIDELHKLGY
jgi:hypothetical protein